MPMKEFFKVQKQKDFFDELSAKTRLLKKKSTINMTDKSIKSI